MILMDEMINHNPNFNIITGWPRKDAANNFHNLCFGNGS